MIWFSASCNCTSLPNSLGLPAFPLRMISVCGSNKLTSFPGNWVKPSKTRALVCRTTRRTCSAMVSSRSPSSRTPLRRRGGRASTSCNTRRESWRICRVTRSSCRYSFFALQFPFRSFVTEGLSDGDHPLGHRAHPVAHFLPETARLRFDLFHGPRQHPRAIVQQAAVGGIVDVAFHYRGTHPQFAPPNHPALWKVEPNSGFDPKQESVQLEAQSTVA